MATATTIAPPPEPPTLPDVPAARQASLPQWQTLRLFGRGRHQAFEAGSERTGDL
ncbi:MAG: hypothetical protein QOF83_4190 [Solirubrobacteraceae bacterium]|jgi:hypothetical protein|nr:hypothetical protein [Solirubrobacteraceae bacterium]